MIHLRNGHLEVLEEFFVDRTLPKYVVPADTKSGISFESEGGTFGNTIMANSPMAISDYMSYGDQMVEYYTYRVHSDRRIGDRVRLWMAKRLLKHSKTEFGKGTDYAVIGQFFQDVIQSVKELELPMKSVEFYNDLVSNAVKLGQVALSEKLMSQKSVLLAELSMIHEHKVKYVTEEDILEYNKKAKENKHLYLTWIKNFARIIPEPVIEMKNYCDEKGWFDNYVVLHFDRLGKSAEMTNAEKEKAKDPILFGMIQGSDKFYFVADWEDDYCDLTLDRMLKVLGKKTTSLNVKSVKSRIEKIRV